MQKSNSTAIAIIAVAAFMLLLVLMKYGTLSPCGMLRASIQQHDKIAAVLPDGLVDAIMQAQYGGLSPVRCLNLLVNGNVATESASRSPSQSMQQRSAAQMTEAWKETAAAFKECKAERLNGELKTYVASAKCSNPKMIEAFSKAHYRYMDLIMLFTAKRLELAEEVDDKKLTEAQAQLELSKFFTHIVDKERQRDLMVR